MYIMIWAHVVWLCHLRSPVEGMDPWVSKERPAESDQIVRKRWLIYVSLAHILSYGRL